MINKYYRDETAIYKIIGSDDTNYTCAFIEVDFNSIRCYPEATIDKAQLDGLEEVSASLYNQAYNMHIDYMNRFDELLHESITALNSK